MEKHGSKLTEEICSRSVNKSKNENFDFNTILANRDNQYDDWTDKSFVWENMFEWEDMNVDWSND